MNVSSDELLRRCVSVKKRFLRMYRGANAGHVGSSLSCAEILTFVRFAGIEREDDELVLSKGHAAAALYSVLAEAGDLPEEEIATFYADGTFLPAHPPVNHVRRIPFATGSLGHGLSLAAGLALAERLKGQADQGAGKDPARVFCVTSDGELNEGSTWEAALFAAHHGLTNLFWFIDRNGLQGFGRTEDVMGLEPLDAKLASFGWRVCAVEGHDFDSLAENWKKVLAAPSSRPTVFVCKTTKGNGTPEVEDTIGCHYLPLTEKQYEALVAELEADLAGRKAGVA